MQVQPPLQFGLSHAHPAPDQNHTHTNGIHSDARNQYSTQTNGHINGDEMHPYQHPYAGGHGIPQQQQIEQQQQQQRQYPPNQLPPMYPSRSVASMPPPPGPSLAGPGNIPQTGMYPAAPQQQLLLPPGPSGQPQPQPQEEKLMSFVGKDGRHSYELRVEQQPQRARMCGFGDKDRRPITPPPCVRLIILDLRTRQPVKLDELDGTFYVLQVDLWDENAGREVNIVRSSSASPAVSISTATTTSFPPTVDRPTPTEYAPPMMYSSLDGQPLYPPAGYMPTMGRPSIPGGQYPNMYHYPPSFPGPAYPGVAVAQPQNHSMFTRNLIGSLTVNASWLKDPEGKQGFWFVLQDLSVRTEGFFRLRMNFIDVGSVGGSGLNRGKAPVLAYVFSDKFQVYSAKKFPGVIESTPLSKCFAGQGIKIPIRKDVKAERDGDNTD